LSRYWRNLMRHGEFHKVHHASWLRAAVMGANDGIISTASLIMGMAAAQVPANAVILAGVAGLVAGAFSMAAGEYVSVRSQADTEAADLARERFELDTEPELELRELTEIYVNRGLDRELAHDVAVQLTAHDALGAHARDELGLVEFLIARPFQAAWASALSFSLGALVPLIVVLLGPSNVSVASLFVVSLVALAVLGASAARVGGANLLKGAWRVCSWGAIAMLATGLIGRLFGIAF
jgi:vacuolar iron transporter family protein